MTIHKIMKMCSVTLQFYLGGLQEINLELAKLLCKSGSAAVPVQKLCPQCRTFDPNYFGEEFATDVKTPESTAHDNFD